jgi:uncharacterized membrane protein (DUF485 family)
MFHGPASEQKPDYASGAKTRLGVWMFILYALVYAGFVALNIATPALMEKRIVLGLNLAVSYGFGLIVFALLLALIYNSLCATHEAKAEHAATKTKEGE